MQRRSPSGYFLALLLLSSSLFHLDAEASIKIIAQKEQFGSVDCLPSNVSAEDRENTSCELSAVIHLPDGRLLIANDQPMPGSVPSAIVWIPVPQESKRHIAPSGYIRQPAVASAKKFEEMTMTPQGTLIAITGHDRYLENSATLDAYCEILTWDWRHPGAVTAISGLLVGEELTPVRKAMSQALTPAGSALIPYLKIEGLCVLPDQTLLFGVREMGQDYSHCSNQIRFLQIGYQEPAPGLLQLKGTFKEIYNLTSEKQQLVMRAYKTTREYNTTGVSSIIYDAPKNRILFMTTNEGPVTLLPNGYEDKAITGYLWWLSFDELKQGSLPHPVLDDKGEPLCFKGHKPEGMSFLSENRLFIICDEDRVASPMNPGEPLRDRTESPYFIYRLQEVES